MKRLAPFVFVALSTAALAQPGIEWQSNIAGSEYDRAYSVVESPGGGFMVVGHTYTNQNYDIQLVKLDIRGGEVWKKTFGASGDELARCIINDHQGGYLIAGHTSSKGAGDRDFWMLKVDTDGKLLWDKTFGGRFEDKPRSVIGTSDGGYLVVGYQMVKGSSTIHQWVIKLDGQGNKVWESLVGPSFRNYAESVCETTDGYVVAGYLHPSSNEDYKKDMGRVMKFDSLGNITWEKILGGEKDDVFNDVAVLASGEMYVVGRTASKGAGRSDIWLVKLDRKGSVLWERTFGDISAEEAYSVEVDESENCIIAARVSSRETASDDWLLVKYSSSGELLWKKESGTQLNDKPFDITGTADGGFVVAGESCTHYNYDSKPVKCSMSITKLQGTPAKSVKVYVDKKMVHWETRGEFEKTESYQKRVTDENRKAIHAKHTREAIDYYASQAVDLEKGTIGSYNADKEMFELQFNAIGKTDVAVAIEEAQGFKESWNRQQIIFEHPHFGLEGDSFTLSSVDLVINGQVYSYNTEKAPGIFILTGKREVEEAMRGGGDPLKGLNVAKTKELNSSGKYYALIIGVDNYKGQWNPLNNAVRDAQAVELMLKKKYRFNHFKTLYDEEATREKIINAMYWLVQTVKENDNVFIYYSGHGQFDKKLNKGYWVPVDAQTSSMSVYISNSDIQTFLNGIQSKHTLLVADACFSGDIFRGNTIKVPFDQSEKYYSEVSSIKSRQAMTSGGVEPVMDGGKDGHSVFAYYFLRALNTNQHRYLDAAQLFNRIKVPVVNNSDQSPNLQPIKNTGDEGGQFIFIKK